MRFFPAGEPQMVFSTSSGASILAARTRRARSSAETQTAIHGPTPSDPVPIRGAVGSGAVMSRGQTTGDPSPGVRRRNRRGITRRNSRRPLRQGSSALLGRTSWDSDGGKGGGWASWGTMRRGRSLACRLAFTNATTAARPHSTPRRIDSQRAPLRTHASKPNSNAGRSLKSELE